MATVLISADERIASAIQRGARRYIAGHRLDWPVRPLPWHGEPNDYEVMTYPGQVVILGWRMGDELFQSIAGRGWLIAEMSHTTIAKPPGLTHVWPDDISIGHAAGAYLVDAGFRQVFFRDGNKPNNPIRHRRNEGLLCQLQQSGIGCEAIDLPTNPTDDDAAEHVRAVLAASPRPAALFCYQDQEALWHLNMLQQNGFTIPDDIAVLGVDNSAIAAESEPGLSSVHIDFSMLAERAVAELHRQLAGVVPTPTEPVLVPSCFVKERSSTQTRQHGDPILRRAQTLINRSLPQGLSVATLKRLKLPPTSWPGAVNPTWHYSRPLDPSSASRLRLQSAW